MREAGATVRIPTFAEAFRFWLKLGFISFGGPSGQIAVMHAELVEKRRWISNDRFLHALNYCMLLPGPEAQQLAIYIGWLLRGMRGGVVAGTLFVLPAVILLWVLSLLYVSGGNLPWVAALFEGLKPAVVAIVAIAIVRIGRRVLTSRFSWIVAAAAFAAIFLVRVPFPLIIAGAALAGFLTTKPGRPEDRKSLAPGAIVHPCRAALCCIALWWTPILLTGLIFGWQHTLSGKACFSARRRW